jgi:hypothetical protein
LIEGNFFRQGDVLETIGRIVRRGTGASFSGVVFNIRRSRGVGEGGGDRKSGSCSSFECTIWTVRAWTLKKFNTSAGKMEGRSPRKL